MCSARFENLDVSRIALDHLGIPKMRASSRIGQKGIAFLTMGGPWVRRGAGGGAGCRIHCTGIPFGLPKTLKIYQ